MSAITTTKKVVRQIPTPTIELLILTTQSIQTIKKAENLSTDKCYFGAQAANRPPPRNRRRDGQDQVHQTNAQNNSNANVQAAPQTLN